MSAKLDQLYAPKSRDKMKTRIFTAAVALVISGCGGSGDGSNSSEPPEPPPVAQTPDTRSPSVGRSWNDVLLDAIRNDFARPTVHARNLFHISAAMYDAWAVYSDTADTYLLGQQLGSFNCDLASFTTPVDSHPAREEALAYAAYRLILHRFSASPGAVVTIAAADSLMQQLGFNTAVTSVDYQSGSPSAMGNYIADCYINYGLQDGANEANDYANIAYTPVNPPIEPELPGNPDIVDLDRWQPISLALFIDQAGNVITDEPEFLSPEWGQVTPFALTPADKTTYQRDGFDYEVYMDPGPPPGYTGDSAADYKWGFALVAIWASHLDNSDGVMIDISPASVGNIQQYPDNTGEYEQFYDLINGGDPGEGYASNPVTGEPYVQQIVPRGDYARVLAEFWADGPDSETPPGHWFVLLNDINDNPELVRQFGGEGPELGPLEWDVKAYFALGGAMHDSAIAAWSIKGWYDYLRPISAIRAMADRGQSSDPAALSYSVDGIPLLPGFIEVVDIGDPLAGPSNEHVGKIKLYTWRGPDYIGNPGTDVAGVGWILAENWWPYQRPSFVTPPFAGYVSGHSTYSRAAAEILTQLTGSAYFPGGMSQFDIAANDFLVFENGPSVGMSLQWATYRDAADQCSLSRIWGGIHPPADDIPGRLIGAQIGPRAFTLAKS
jgi:hypothetical protein